MSAASVKFLRQVMKDAADILIEDAEGLRESCEGGTPARNWACDECPARRKDGRCQGEADYDEQMRLAGHLRDAAGNETLRIGKRESAQCNGSEVKP